MTRRTWSIAVVIGALAGGPAQAGPQRAAGAARAVRQVDVIVLRVHVPLYTDPQCTHRLRGVWGVVFDDQGRRAIFPSTRDHFHAGDRVSWEWNLRATWGETWYRDPDSHRIEQAWLSSAEFVGRPLGQNTSRKPIRAYIGL